MRIHKKRSRGFGLVALSLGIVLALSACGAQAAAPFDGPMSGASGGNTGAYAPEEAQVEVAPSMPDAAVAREAEGGAVAQAPGADQATSNSASAGTERLIIKTGSITLSADDTKKARESIEQMIQEMSQDGAFIVSSDESGAAEGVSPYINITIRIPAARFDETMDRIAALAVEGTTPSRYESGQDVTAEYVDLEARLQSLEAARERLLTLMQQAETTDALLQAEAQLTQREAEIAAIKGQMKYLSESAALSSISISLQPYVLSQPVDTSWKPAETVRRAFDALLDSLRGAGDFLITFGIFCLPWLLALGAVIFLIWRFIVKPLIERRRARKAAQAAASES